MFIVVLLVYCSLLSTIAVPGIRRDIGNQIPKAQVIDIGYPGHYKIETYKHTIYKPGGLILFYAIEEIQGSNKLLPLQIKVGPIASGKIYKIYDQSILDIELSATSIQLQPGQYFYIECPTGNPIPSLTPYPIPKGTLAVSSDEGKGILLFDGYEAGEMQAGPGFVLSQVPAGEHTLAVSIGDRLAWKASITIQAEQKTSVLIPYSAYVSPFEPETLLLPGGSFLMGSNNGMEDEKPVHKISVQSFRIGKYEITNAEFAAFVSDTGYRTDAEKAGASQVITESAWRSIQGADWSHPTGPSSHIKGMERFPVIHVSWNDCVQYTKWLAQKTDKPYRLPTEAEWEYACRAGTTTEFWWGDSFDRTKANCASTRAGFDLIDLETWKRWRKKDKSQYLTVKVGSFPPNPWGLFDIIGNVWEWCSTQYKEYPYSATDGRESMGASDTITRTFRGGAWRFQDIAPRAARRGMALPNLSFDICGFRVAVDEETER